MAVDVFLFVYPPFPRQVRNCPQQMTLDMAPGRIVRRTWARSFGCVGLVHPSIHLWAQHIVLFLVSHMDKEITLRIGEHRHTRIR